MIFEEITKNTTIPFAYRLAYLINSYREPLLRQIEDDLGISRPEWTVLWSLSMREGIIAKDISDLTGQARNSISRAVISLDKRGLIERRPHPSDGRAALLHLTEAGWTLFNEVMPSFEQREVDLVSGLTAEEQRHFLELLKKLSGHVPNWV